MGRAPRPQGSGGEATGRRRPTGPSGRPCARASREGHGATSGTAPKGPHFPQRSSAEGSGRGPPPPHERRALSLQPPLRPPLALRPSARPSAPPTNARSAAWLPDPRPSPGCPPGCPRLWGRHAGRCARHPCTSPRLLSPAEGRVGPFRLQTARLSAPLVCLTRAGRSMTTEGWGWPGVATASLLSNCPAASRSRASVSPAGSARVQRVRLRGAALL